MPFNRTFAVLLISAVAIAACERSPTGPDSTETPRFAKGGNGGGNGGGGGGDGDPLAIWRFHSVLSDAETRSALRGDGRLADGSTGEPSTYQGEVCGVRAKIHVSNGGGDAVLDPDAVRKKAKSCGDARSIVIDADGTTHEGGAFVNALGIWWMAAGDSEPRKVVFDDTGVAGCERLIFESARITRTAESPGRWTVETEGDHAASCQTKSGPRYEDNGTRTLPFSAEVEEVPGE